MWYVWRIGEVRSEFWWGDTWERDNLVDLGVDGMRILKEVGWGDTDWIYLAKDMYRWRALVTAVMNIGFPQNAGNFLTS
jgi:hypothetical protein